MTKKEREKLRELAAQAENYERIGSTAPWGCENVRETLTEGHRWLAEQLRELTQER
jgi:hypothetical protein